MNEALAEAKRLLDGLISGEVAREDAADWAMARIRDESAAYHLDEALWGLLDELGGADLREPAGEYLHGVEDFEAWKAEIDAVG